MTPSQEMCGQNYVHGVETSYPRVWQKRLYITYPRNKHYEIIGPQRKTSGRLPSKEKKEPNQVRMTPGGVYSKIFTLEN